MKPTTEQIRNLGLLNNQSLLPEWQARCKLRIEGDKLYAEGYKLYDEGYKLWTEGTKLRTEGIKIYDAAELTPFEGDKLYAEAHKLWAEGNKLYAEARKLWAEAVTNAFGSSMRIEWLPGDGCRLGNGEVYRADD